MARFAAAVIVLAWVAVSVSWFFANDALGYQAAGERLNDGHQLYALSPGDRLVEISPPYWTSPFLYPPLWGIVWRPLAALPFGLALWMAVVTVAMLGWLFVTLRSGWTLAVLLLAPSFGVLLASGNVAGLFLVGMAAVPSMRGARAGILVGVMGAVKVMPAVLIVWLIATRQWRAAAWAGGTGAVLTLAAFLYDPALTWQYVRDVIPSTKAMGIAPASLLGIPAWSTWVILAVCLVVVLWRRSYAASVTGVVLGSPAVGVAGLAMLGAGRPLRA